MVHIVDYGSNDYLLSRYFQPLAKYLYDQGEGVVWASEVTTIKNSIVLIHGDKLSPEKIELLKNNGNKVVCFDINDSSYFSSAYHNSDQTSLIDLIFKVSGVPKTNYTLDPSIDRNFGITSSEVRYLPENEWEAFKRIKDAGKIKPLPYVLWNPLNTSGEALRPYNARSGKVLVRGGNHFWRVVLFFRLMQEGLDDSRSQFATAAYFSDGMEERFKYCESCITEKKTFGKTHYATEHDHKRCKSPATWGISGEMFGGPAFGRNEFGYWNNRCPASFFWLAKEFEKNRGPLNHDGLERALNGDMQPFHEFVRDLGQASFYSDLKWLLTIYLPPRFWEAAAVGTVNLLPRRTDDQDYFPVIEKDVHYVAYPEDLSNFDDMKAVDEKKWNDISRASKEVYETWIRGTQYAISTNLLKHIKDRIMEIA
jgi:hypothetical protein